MAKHLAAQKQQQAPASLPMSGMGGGGCPGSRVQAFAPAEPVAEGAANEPSQLRQWPIQLHLVSPLATYFQGADLLLAADCVAFTVGDFHKDHLKGKALAIACPKLDSNQEIYEEKLRILVDQAKINTLTVMIMQVPCCSGLLQTAREALSKASRKIPLKLQAVTM